MAKALPRRDEVPRADQWAVESVFPSEEAFEEAFTAAGAAIPAVAQFTGTLGSSPARLLEALRARDQINDQVNLVRLYASMLRSGDVSNVANLARADRTGALSAKLHATTAFFEPELLAVPPATIIRYLDEEPGLAPYRHYFDRLSRLRDHVRSREVEELLAQASDVTSSPAQIHGTLENAELKFGSIKDEQGEPVELAQGNSGGLISSAVRSVRRDAWQAYADGYLSVKSTMAAALSGGIKRDVFYARARRYPSAREATMQPHNLPIAVFDNLIATVRANLPLWHRYWAIRQRALGVATLHPYDLHVPLATAETVIDFDRGSQILLEGLAPLGEEYVAALSRGLTEERWVDKYPNVGKGSGAFSTGVYGARPFIMMNYHDSLLSLSTLAHELGHSVHSFLTWQNQPSIYQDYSMFVAETASNFNQALLRAHLLNTSDDRRFKIAVIEEGMSNFKRYLFIMPILAQFELDAHERVERGDAVTATTMSAKIEELYREGYGDGVVMDAPRVGITWAQFPHMFGNFYVYQYATGISAANALADSVVKEGAPAAERYVRFLKAGGSMYPLDALRIAGVDMATPEPIERAFGVLKGLVDQLETLVGDEPLPWLPMPDC